MKNLHPLPKFKLTKTVVTCFTRPGKQPALGKTSTDVTTSLIGSAY